MTIKSLQDYQDLLKLKIGRTWKIQSDKGLEWNNSNEWERVSERRCMPKRDLDVGVHGIF